MRRNPFVVLGCLAAFLLLAAISCWATEQSLHLLLPSGWPELLVWGITIAFFLVASYGTKLITDSLGSQAFIDNRRLKLIGGLILVLFFWLLMSMPTNTHTFFYNDEIGNVVTKDIETTNKYLDQIIARGKDNTSLALDSVGKLIKDSVEEERTHMVKQFNGDEAPYRRDNGEKISEHIKNINRILNSGIKQDYLTARVILSEIELGGKADKRFLKVANDALERMRLEVERQEQAGAASK